MIECIPLKHSANHRKPIIGIKLVRAAVRSDDKVYTGWRHADIMRHMQEQGCHPVGQDDQGFIDQDGIFYRRACCASIAYRNGQIKEMKDELFSEDLWDSEGEDLG